MKQMKRNTKRSSKRGNWKYINTTHLSIFLLFISVCFFSCEKEDQGKYQMTEGKPTVHFVRYQSSEESEKLLDGAFMGENIVIIGDNITSVLEVFYNNVKSLLNIYLITYIKYFLIIEQS